MTNTKHVEMLKPLVEKAIYHKLKSQEYSDEIIEYLKEMGYLNHELIVSIVTEILLNTNSCKTPKEYIEDIFENLNVEGNF